MNNSEFKCPKCEKMFDIEEGIEIDRKFFCPKCSIGFCPDCKGKGIIGDLCVTCGIWYVDKTTM